MVHHLLYHLPRNRTRRGNSKKGSNCGYNICGIGPSDGCTFFYTGTIPNRKGAAAMFRCPIEEKWFGYFASGETRSYSMNAGRQAGNPCRGISRAYPVTGEYRRVAEVADTSGTLLLVERRNLLEATGSTFQQQRVMSGGQWGNSAWCDNPFMQSDSNQVRPFHNKKWNYLFCCIIPGI